MALTTSLEGRVRNTSLPKSHSLLPVLEAVVNSIQAIDARFGNDVAGGKVGVAIERSTQEEFELGLGTAGRVPLRPIVGFKVTDNGVGFTSENMTSFETLDSSYKAKEGCRGVGRLVWLKAFERVHITSAYRDETEQLVSRSFRFSIKSEVEPLGGRENFSGAWIRGALVRLQE